MLLCHVHALSGRRGRLGGVVRPDQASESTRAIESEAPDDRPAVLLAQREEIGVPADDDVDAVVDFRFPNSVVARVTC